MERNFSEPGRIEKAIEKKPLMITQKDWRKSLESHFVENLKIIEKQGLLINKLELREGDEILRSQISFLMSLYDYTIHEIVKYKMIDIFNNSGVKPSEEVPKKYNQFKVSIKTLKHAINNPTNASWLIKEIEWQNGKLSFINPEKTMEALKIVNDKEIFKEYCLAFNLDYDDFLRELKKLNDRRNKIVHEMDMKDRRQGIRDSVEVQLVNKWIELIKQLVVYLIQEI